MWQEHALSVMMNAWKGFIQRGGLLQHCRNWWCSVIPRHHTDQQWWLARDDAWIGWKGPAEQAVLIHFAWNDLFKSNLLLFFSRSNPMDSSTPRFPVLHHLLQLVQTHVHRVSNVIQPAHPLSSTSPPAFYLPQHQGLFKWAGSSHQVAKVMELQLHHRSFQWIFRTDFL